MNKDAGGVVIVFLGFAAVVMAFKGTWADVWHSLVHGTPAPNDFAGGGAGGAENTTPGQRNTGPGGGGNFPTTPSSSGRPGSSPVPLAPVQIT